MSSQALGLFVFWGGMKTCTAVAVMIMFMIMIFGYLILTEPRP